MGKQNDPSSLERIDMAKKKKAASKKKVAKKKATKKSAKKKKKAAKPSLASRFGKRSLDGSSRVDGEHPAETRGRVIGTTSFGRKQESPLKNVEREAAIWEEDQREAEIVREALTVSDNNAEVLARQVSEDKDGEPKKKGYLQGMAQQTKTMNWNYRNDYWCCLVFVTADQREQFTKNAGWNMYQDQTGMYYDGLAIAESLGVELEDTPVKFRTDDPDLRLVKECGVIPKERYGKDWKP